SAHGRSAQLRPREQYRLHELRWIARPDQGRPPGHRGCRRQAAWSAREAGALHRELRALHLRRRCIQRVCRVGETSRADVLPERETLHQRRLSAPQAGDRAREAGDHVRGSSSGTTPEWAVKGDRMKTPRGVVALTVVNVVLALSSLGRFVQPARAEDPPPVLRARALQIVDDQGRVRASLAVLPAATSAGGVTTQETVL